MQTRGGRESEKTGGGGRTGKIGVTFGYHIHRGYEKKQEKGARRKLNINRNVTDAGINCSTTIRTEVHDDGGLTHPIERIGIGSHKNVSIQALCVRRRETPLAAKGGELTELHLGTPNKQALFALWYMTVAQGGGWWRSTIEEHCNREASSTTWSELKQELSETSRCDRGRETCAFQDHDVMRDYRQIHEEDFTQCWPLGQQ
ncbi:hypothetical protein BU15DRAFT_69376 [Melanogaster broomeanus]|nr:hypothetical protein BU15DRAFT_69376 [Melanogaster broomeanus]